MKKLVKKVFVGLSGGVDSAVSAGLLKKGGYEVTGVFIKAWTPPGYPCTWKEDRRSAMRVAAVLDIPFVTLDLENEYKKGVVDYMIAEYRAGRTPNPDVMCNKEIKFGAFLSWAKKQEAEYVATGHYARVNKGPLFSLDSKGGPLLTLMEGSDKNKDQSYFLWTLTQKQLKHILFPIGHLQKEEVRKLAKRFELPQATRKDSQGLCFLGQVDMKEFLSRYIEQKRGDVLDEAGEVIGFHNGATFFTIGERHGFTVIKKTSEDTALYVVSKDVKTNTITVTPNITAHGALSQWEPLTLDNVNWIAGKLTKKTELLCRLRYRQKKIPCSIEISNRETKVLLQEESYISPGQSLVLYDTRPNDLSGRSEECLGGGVVQ